MGARLGTGLALTALLIGACGGRFEERTGGTSTGGTSTGGTATEGAVGSEGATTSVGGTLGLAGAAHGGKAGRGGGTTGGTASVGGAIGTGGSSVCACPAIACGPGNVPVPNPNGCCFHCESMCQGVTCGVIACASGSHLQQGPNQCCPSCVPDSCEAQHMGYAAWRQQLVDKYSSEGCKLDSDCTLYYEKNNCALGCGIPMPVSSIGNLDSNLQSYAEQNCTPNCMGPIPPCDSAPVACIHGSCALDDGVAGAAGAFFR